MKGIPVLLSACTLIVGAADADTLTLTRNDVGSAEDIEAAIASATHYGTVPGRVILDGRDGPFTYAGGDRVINIAVSNLALAGVNGATLEDCDGGGAVRLEPVPLENLLVENLTFHCASGGIFVIDESLRQNFTIRDNVFHTQGAAVFINHLVEGKVYNNIIDAGGTPTAAIFLNGARGSEIVGNRISNADAGIHLGTEASLDSTGNRVVANRIANAVVGINLGGNASANSVVLNRITLSAAGHTGILLGDGTHENKVLFNSVSSEVGGSFTTVDDQGTGNRVSRNKP